MLVSGDRRWRTKMRHRLRDSNEEALFGASGSESDEAQSDLGLILLNS